MLGCLLDRSFDAFVEELFGLLRFPESLEALNLTLPLLNCREHISVLVLVLSLNAPLVGWLSLVLRVYSIYLVIEVKIVLFTALCPSNNFLNFEMRSIYFRVLIEPSFSSICIILFIVRANIEKTPLLLWI